MILLNPSKFFYAGNAQTTLLEFLY
jgi:hypothetical protein